MCTAIQTCPHLNFTEPPLKMSKKSLILVMIGLGTVQCLKITRYREEELCNSADRIKNGCYTQDSGFSLLDCAVKCQIKPVCAVFIFSTQNATCYVESSCAFQPNCSVFEADLHFYVSETGSASFQGAAESSQEEEA